MNRELPPRSSATGETSTPGLPQRAASRTHDKIVIAHHLILHAYGHWLPNDPRGSGSEKLHEEKLADLGPIHHGRKRVQPPREELKRFYRRAEPLLDFPTLWFDETKRQAVGGAFGKLSPNRVIPCRYRMSLSTVIRLLSSIISTSYAGSVPQHTPKNAKIYAASGFGQMMITPLPGSRGTPSAAIAS